MFLTFVSEANCKVDYSQEKLEPNTVINEVRMFDFLSKTIGTQYCEQWSKFGELERIKKIVGLIAVNN